VRLSRDTYLPRAATTDLRDRLPAILLTAPPGAVVSHQTAAALWRVEIPLQSSEGRVHLTVPPESRARNRRDRQLHRGRLAPGDVERRWSLPVTSRSRTWRDLAGVLPLADPRAESPMESVLRWLLHEAGLPAPALQLSVHDLDGVLIGRADMAWPDKKVLVEFDGNVHRDRDVFINDLRRQNRLIAAGWAVLRFSSADVLGHPERVIAAVRAALVR
jgi:hypothetical protein